MRPLCLLLLFFGLLAAPVPAHAPGARFLSPLTRAEAVDADDFFMDMLEGAQE